MMSQSPRDTTVWLALIAALAAAGCTQDAEEQPDIVLIPDVRLEDGAADSASGPPVDAGADVPQVGDCPPWEGIVADDGVNWLERARELYLQAFPESLIEGDDPDGDGVVAPSPEDCANSVYPEGGDCYQCLTRRCCEPLALCSIRFQALPSGTPVWTSCFDDGLGCIRDCVAQSTVAWRGTLDGCTEQCALSWTPAPEFSDTSDVYPAYLRALAQCATAESTDAACGIGCAEACFGH